MGKIVKFCASCEESFAEKFSFCPNCASELSPFEMTPVEENPVAETSRDLDIQSEIVEMSPIVVTEKVSIPDEPIAEDPLEVFGEEAVFEPISFSDESVDRLIESAEMDSDEIFEMDAKKPDVEEGVFAAEESRATTRNKEEKIEAVAPVSTAVQPSYSKESVESGVRGGDDGFNVTVVSEKNGSVRNGLLLSAAVLIIFGFVGLMIVSLFSNLGNVPSLSDEDFLVALLSENPTPTEEPEKKKNDDKGGGGGGGGSENSKPVSKGEMVSQQTTLPPPPKVLPRIENPSMPKYNITQGTNKTERTTNAGDPNSLGKDPSSGTGSGGGIGSGKGTGQGSGYGTGQGSGTGSGSGSGKGTGNGSGTGPGSGAGLSRPPKLPPKPVKPRQPPTPMRILGKPKPGYTDAARQHNVRGVVRVRVAFLASGRIGSVAVVKGLPHGLTAKAIAAAKRIRFKPPTRNGVPYSVNKVVQFSFTIY